MYWISPTLIHSRTTTAVILSTLSYSISSPLGSIIPINVFFFFPIYENTLDPSHSIGVSFPSQQNSLEGGFCSTAPFPFLPFSLGLPPARLSLSACPPAVLVKVSSRRMQSPVSASPSVTFRQHLTSAEPSLPGTLSYLGF